INETPAQKAAKRRKLNEEVKDLKKHLKIVLDEDDDQIDKLKFGRVKGLSMVKQRLRAGNQSPATCRRGNPENVAGERR
nr:hypothetical protein [Tanacetum cinerariifolium]